MRFTRTPRLTKFLALFSVAVVAISSAAVAQKTGQSLKSESIPVTTPDSFPPSMQNTVQVMVELQDAPAAATWAAALKQAQAQADAQRNYALQHPNLKTSQALLKTTPQRVQISSTAARQVQSVAQRLDQSQKALLTSLTGPKISGRVIYRAQLAYNGIAMVVSPDKIADITALPGVKGVHPMNPKFPTAAFSDIDFLGTRGLWTKDGLAGNLGDGVVVADIDTGLDYIHTNFGGSGTYPASPHTGAFAGTLKAPIGYDFAGDAYDANTSPIPSPDPDPFDCAGHGTGTASLIAGYGVKNDGSTYFLSYNAANPDMSTLKCAPGLAPHASLAALRVFGCGGSTNLVTDAIEWVIGYNMNAAVAGYPAGTHNPPFIHVINMSLGSNEGFADDPDDVAASNAASTGVIVCSAAGNAGDSYYIHSSPAAAAGTLGVAATFNDQNGYIFDSTVTGNAPPSFAGQQDKTIYTTTASHTSASADVIYAVNPISPGVAGSTIHDGGQPLTNAAFCANKIVMVDRIPGQGSAASVNCQNAGAAGIIDVADNNAGGNPFLLTTSPALTKPMVVCSTSYGTAIKTTAAFDANGVSTSVPAVNVTIAPGAGSVIQPSNPPGSPAGAGSPDTLPTYSSRGPRLPDSAIKPDLAAPAEVTGVALALSGNGIENFNGTSSATPHVAGEMALLRQLHPTWSVQELLALACDTATHDMATTVGGATKIGVGRIGAGRIDLTNAGNANVVAYNGTDSNLVGVSFGVVETPVDGSTSLTKNITVTNKGGTNVTYNTSVVTNPALAGTTFTLGSSSFTVNAGSSTTVSVTFAATGSALKHAREGSVSATQGNPRQWLTESAGYAVLTPTDASPVLRVALYAAPKPTSSMHATITGVVPTAPNTGSFNINLSGSPVNTGASLGNGFDILSLVKALELQYINPAVGSPTASTDRNVIKFVGITSDYVTRAPTTAARIVWGLEGFGDAPEPRFTSSDREIFLDTGDGLGGPPDGIFDFAVYLSNNGTGQENVFLPIVVKLHANTAASSGRFTNGLAANVADTNAYNNSCVTMQVDASSFIDAANGYPALATAGHTRFNYQVVTFDRNGDEVDETPILTYDLAAPGMEVENSAVVAQTVFSSSNDHVENFWYKDLPSNFVPVNYNGTNFKANFSKGVMLMHMHNGDGNRVDVIAFRKPTISSFSPASGTVGTQITITGSNFGPGTTVKFQSGVVASVNVLTSNTLVATVPAGAVDGPIRVENAAGFSTKPGFDVLP